MDAGCFTAAQRMSCHTMNADLFKPVSERGSQQSSVPLKGSRHKAEQTKPELAQVVTDSKTGRSYSKGKLLGKVRRPSFHTRFSTPFGRMSDVLVAACFFYVNR